MATLVLLISLLQPAILLECGCEVHTKSHRLLNPESSVEPDVASDWLTRLLVTQYEGFVTLLLIGD